MKKIWSVILTAILIVVSVAAVPVSAQEVTADVIDIATNVYDIKATVKTTQKLTMTAMIAEKTMDGSEGQHYGFLSVRTPEEISRGVYKYEFNFRMPQSASTKTYVLSIGFKNARYDKDFTYVALNDKINFYEALNLKTSGEIKNYFEANSLLVPVDLTMYNGIEDADVLTNVNDAIADLNLATGVTDADTTEQKTEKLSVVDNLFATRFAELMETASLVTAEKEAWILKVNELLGTEFDDKFYIAEATDGTPLNVADVYENFKKELSAMNEFTMAECSLAFDRATLTLTKDSRSAGVLKTAFLYFAEKGSITADMTDINKLIEDDKDSDLWKELKSGAYENCIDLVEEAEKIAEEMATSSTNGTTGGTNINKPAGNGGGGSLGGGASLGGGGSASSKPTTKPETPVKVTFTDIASVDWAKESIEALAEKGVINGKEEGKFAPNDSVTREEFVKIIIGAFDLLDEDAKADFADVDSTRWSYAFIATANELGIVTGDGKAFNPTGAMSRQDMAVVIYRIAEKLGLKLSGDAESFTDSDNISDYAKDAIKALTANGIINGMGDGTFAPKLAVTRAQAAKVIYGLIELIGGGK